MAVAFSAVSESHTSTSGSASEASFGWSHTQTGVPAGVLVFVFTNANATDATGVTYGTDTLSAVSGGTATDASGEPRSVQTYFLGKPTVTGNQTVTVSRNNNTNVMYAVCFTVTATGSTECVVGTTASADASLAEVNVDDGSLSGTNSVRFCAMNSALNSVPSAGASTTTATGYSIDFGTNVIFTGYETTPGTGSRPVGFSTGTSDDLAAVYVAVREASRVKSPGQGTVAVTGNAPSLTYEYKREPAAGSVTVTGYAPSSPRTVSVSWVQLVVPPVAAAVNTDRSPGAGTVEVTGQAPSLLRDTRITPDAGAAAATGQAPETRTDFRIEVPAGSVVTQGFAPVAQRADSVFPGAGSVTATGQDVYPSATDNRNIEVTSGAIVATGYAPYGDRTDHQPVAPPAGAVTISGAEPYVQVTGDVYAYPGSGSAEVSGQAPRAENSGDRSVSVSWLQLVTPAEEGTRSVYPDPGTVTVSGNAPYLQAQTYVYPGAGSIEVTGLTARPGTVSVLIEWDDISGEDGYRVKWGEATGSYHWSADVAADATSYTIVGLVYDTTYFVRIYGLVGGVEQDPSDEIVLTAGRGYVPDPASVVITGYAPTVGGSHTARPDAGSVTVTGQAPRADRNDDAFVYPGAGSIVADGQSPALANAIHVGAASVEVAGYEPPLEQTRHVDAYPGAGTVTVEGQAPTVDAPAEITPDAGSVVVTGYAPTVEQTGLEKPHVGIVGRGRQRVWVKIRDGKLYEDLGDEAEARKVIRSIKRKVARDLRRAERESLPPPEIPVIEVDGAAPFVASLQREVDELHVDWMRVAQRLWDDYDEDDLEALLL